jgi:hypothetical protein
MQRAVYYTFACGDNGIPAHYMREIALSTSSLRAHSPSIPIFFFLFGTPTQALEGHLSELDVQLVHCPPYAEKLTSIAGPRRGEILALYRVLHKWLCCRKLIHKNCSILMSIHISGGISRSYLIDTLTRTSTPAKSRSVA